MMPGILLAAAFPDSLQSPEHSLAALQQITSDSFFRAVEVPIMDDRALAAARQLLKHPALLVDVDAGAELYRRGASLCSLEAADRLDALDIVHSLAIKTVH